MFKQCVMLLNAEHWHYVSTVVQLFKIRTQPPSSHSLFRKEFTISSGVYKRLGQFNYGQPSCTTDYIRTCIKEEDDENYGWIYIGEVKEGADDTPHGIGIKVMNGGTIIQEGNWNDGKLHGKGRHILSSGNYYIGEYKGGNYNGEGAYYCNGDKYEGGWKDGNYYGQGTYYKDNGDKYIGQWDGDKGQGEINYTDGKKYIGHWDGDYSYDVYGAYISDYLRHGFGTLYSQKGQVLKEGKWHYDEYKGKE